MAVCNSIQKTGSNNVDLAARPRCVYASWLYSGPGVADSHELWHWPSRYDLSPALL